MEKCKLCNFSLVSYHYIEEIFGEPREIVGYRAVSDTLVGDTDLEDNFLYNIIIEKEHKTPYISTTDGENIPVNYCPVCGKHLKADYKEYIRWITLQAKNMKAQKELENRLSKKANSIPASE